MGGSVTRIEDILSTVWGRRKEGGGGEEKRRQIRIGGREDFDDFDGDSRRLEIRA